MIDEQFHQDIDRLSQLIMDWEQIIQIGYTMDPDPIIAASIFGRTLADLELPFVLFAYEPRESNLEIRSSHPLILIGDEFSHLDELDRDHPYLILTSSSQDLSEDEHFVNLRAYGYDTTEISYTAVAYFICHLVAAEETLSHIIQLPLVSAQTKAMMSEYRGLHEIIAQDAIEARIVEIEKRFAILGENIFGLTDALVYSEKPFNPGLTGNEVEVTQLLAKAGITVETAEGERKLIDLDKEEMTRLISTLTVHMGHKREYQEKFEILKPKTVLITEEGTSILQNCWDYAQAVIDCVNRRRPNLILTVLLGNRGKQYRELSKIFREERQALSISFQIVIDKQDMVEDLSNIRYLVTDHKINWYNASVLAAMGLANGLVTSDLPFGIIAPGPGDLFTIGIRASTTHKLDRSLKEIMQEILDTREIERTVEGGELAVLVSVPEPLYEPIMLDLNAKLGVT